MTGLHYSHSNLLRALVALFLCIGNHRPFAIADETEITTCEACLFDGNDPDDCVIYGKVDDEVVQWSLGTNSCKDNYGIMISSIDPDTSCDSVNAFVASIRFGDLSNSASRLGLGVASDGGAFFVENFQEGSIELADELNINGITMNCETSEGDCYNFMKAYFEEGADGEKEMEQVCEKLYNQVRVDRNLEESTLRIRLCMELKDEQAVPVTCMPLGTQVGDLVRADPERDCSGFGFETPLSSIPACKDVASGEGSTGSSTEDGSDEEEGLMEGIWNDIKNVFGMGDESSANTLFVSNSVSLALLLLATVVIM